MCEVLAERRGISAVSVERCQYSRLCDGGERAHSTEVRPQQSNFRRLDSRGTSGCRAVRLYPETARGTVACRTRPLGPWPRVGASEPPLAMLAGRRLVGGPAGGSRGESALRHWFLAGTMRQARSQLMGKLMAACLPSDRPGEKEAVRAAKLPPARPLAILFTMALASLASPSRLRHRPRRASCRPQSCRGTARR